MRFLDEIFSLTTDLGTEVKISDSEIDRNNMALSMPSFLVHRTGLSPLTPEDATERPETNPFLSCGGSQFLRNAMPISGTGHVIHNAVKGFKDVLGYFGTFFLQLKVLEMALRQPGRRERICATCLAGTHFAQHIPMFMNFSNDLNEARWHAVAAFCLATILALGILRRCFSAAAYSQRGRGELLEKQWEGKEEGQRKFDAKELEQILKCPLFRAYHAMVVKLHYVPGRLQGWFDGCPCHEQLLKSALSSRERRKLMIADGLKHGRCPCSTCRGWQVVDGKVPEVIAELARSTEDELTSLLQAKASDGLTAPMTAEHHATVMSDWSAGIAHLMLSFGIRLRWGSDLPWVLMGMAHPDVARAVHWARRCIALYDAKPESEHHRLSVLFLKVGSVLRLAIQSFVESQVMSGILKLHVAPFHFMPFGDRQIEREHKYMSDVVSLYRKAVKGHIFGIRRLRAVETQMFNDPVFSNKLVEYFVKLRNTRESIKLFGIQHHPLLSDLMKDTKMVSNENQKASVTNNLRNVFEQVIYRQELGIKYESYNIIRRQNDSKARGRKEAEARARKKPVQIPTTAEELLLLNAADHLRTVGQSFGTVTMPDWSLDGMRLETLDTDNFLGLHAQELEDPDAMNHEEDDDDHEPAARSDDDDGDEVVAKRLKTLHDAAIVLAPEADEAETQPINNPLCCFKVLKTQPGRIKSLATFIHHGGDVIGQSAFAVTMHGCYSCTETDNLIVDHLPRVSSRSGMHALVVEDFYPGLCLSTLRSSVKGHYNAGRPSLRFSLPIGDDGSQMNVHDALTKMFEARAVPGKEGFVQGSAVEWPWANLLAADYVWVIGGDDASPTSECVV